MNSVTNETDPSMLSQSASNNLAACVLGILLFYLSHVSNDKLTNESGSLIIVSNSLSEVLIRLKQTCTIKSRDLSDIIWKNSFSPQHKVRVSMASTTIS